MNPFLVCVPVVHAFMIHGDKVTVFVVVVLNVNDGNKKEEASEKKRNEISESDVRSIQNIGTLSYKQYTG